MGDQQFQLALPMGKLLPSGPTANFSEDKGFTVLKQFLPHPAQVVDLTLDEDGDDDDDEDAAEVSWLLPHSLKRRRRF
jgi:hypothetical protein